MPRRRLTGLLAMACAALALGGCNANVSGTQSLAPAATASFAGGPDGAALPSAIPVSSAGIAGSVSAAAQPEAASQAANVEVASTFRAPQAVPEPAPRPDLGDRVQVASAQPAAGVAQPAAPQSALVAAPVAAPAAPAPSEGTTQVAQSAAQPAVQPRRPAGLFSFFGGTAADPAAGPQVDTSQRTAYASMAPASDAPSPATRASLAAYERREAGDEPADEAPQPGKPQQKINFTYTPAVIEVNGVTNDAPTPSSRPPSLLRPVAAVANTFGTLATGGAYGGRRWRPAYPHVVTHCFPPTLRRALDTIGDHFNAEVQVTSGMRANGRRRSMHRSCAAADIRVVGVSPGTVARFAGSVPGINGIGTYRRVAVTHIDTRANRMAWRY